MKELKFRVWDNGHNEFIRPDYGLIGFCYPLDGRISVLTTNGDPMEDCVIEQYTGLKDNNGKEIYEGDIVEFGLSGRPERGYVAYADEYASFEVYSKRDFIFGALFGHTGDVIGNIHENDNLLEDK